ncbi:nucleotidyltransferase [Variovorax soli]|nr:nucleotidyltransferase [Variovorax soli]
MAPFTVRAASLGEEVEPRVADFYRQALHALNDAGIPFLVGGSFAHACYTGIRRSTKDLDLFIRRQDYERIALLMQQHGWRAALSHPHWLAKVYEGPEFIDLIFNSGNGLMPVDERWFQGNCRAEVLGVPVRVVNVEDSLLSKAFIMERERYDGGDIAHVLQACAEQLDWSGLLERFGPHWRVLLAHLTLFGYIYPGERHRIPGWVLADLLQRLGDEMREPAASNENVCAGTLLSREQYLHDIEQLGYVDGRLTPASTMTAQDVAAWTGDIQARKSEARAPEPPAATDALRQAPIIGPLP